MGSLYSLQEGSLLPPEVLEEAVARLRQGRLLLIAPPGSGKSTLLPLALLRAFSGKILLYEPRRLAARMVATRLAENLGEELGRTVGYQVRLEGKRSEKTRLLVETEGLLLRRLSEDPALTGVEVVVLDEVHERHLETDLALALLLKAQRTLRPDLKLLLMSATLSEGEKARFSALLEAPVLEVAGAAHPVRIHHLARPPQGPLEPLAARYAREAFLKGEGNVLVFLPGKAEIERTRALLSSESNQDLPVYPLHGGLSLAEQAALMRPGPRRIYLATNVAETSLTLPEVRVVVDTGLEKRPRFDARTGLTRLVLARISWESAQQRAGRAGRTGPGEVFRLYPEGPLPPRRPEILEADLSQALLLALALGERLEDLPLPDPPPKGGVEAAWRLLSLLGAVEEGRLTPLGLRLLRHPTHPRLARLVLEAEGRNALSLAADLLALLEEKDLLPELGPDLLGRLEALAQDRSRFGPWERASALWRRRFRVPPLPAPEPQEAARLLLAAYPDRAARRVGPGVFQLATGSRIRLELEAEHAVVPFVEGGYGHLALPVPREALLERAELEEWVGWEKGRLLGVLRQKLGALVLEEAPFDAPLTEPLLREALKKGLPLSEEARALQARVLSLRAWNGDWPDLSEEALLEDLSWLLPYAQGVRSLEDLEALPWTEILKGLLGPRWPELEALAPTHLPLPSGRKRLLYSPDGAPPVLRLRIQEAFGLKKTPTVNGGRVRVQVHLLSPAGRPVQVTQDLEGFWERTYPILRKELKGRYPKHAWPEKP